MSSPAAAVPHTLRLSAALILLGLATPGLAAGADSLPGCRAVTDDAERLACYDRVADALPDSASPDQASPPPASAPAASAVPADSAALPSAENLFGRDAVSSEAMVRNAVGIGRLDELEQRITAIEKDPDGKWVISLENAQVWRQLDTRRLRLGAGDEVRIRRAAMGSYLLFGPEMVQGIRVRRLQ